MLSCLKYDYVMDSDFPMGSVLMMELYKGQKNQEHKVKMTIHNSTDQKFYPILLQGK